jgi:Thioesterase-like superfamily
LGEADSIFVVAGDDLYAPTEHARGPWDPSMLHGGAPAALIAAAFERMQPGAELPLARLSFSFLRPIPMTPLQLRTRMTRPGRRVQELAADLYAGEQLVCTARGLRILPVPAELPALALAQVAEHSPPPLADPLGGQPVRFSFDDVQRKSFAATAMEMRFLSGQPLKGELRARSDALPPRRDELPEIESVDPSVAVGHAEVWMRMRHPLLPDETLTPIARVAATADFSNGVSAALPFAEYLFINADLSITLNRRPQGEWIGLDAHTLLHPGGIGWAQSVLHDELGPLGLTQQALVVQPR